jgi:predicted alpha/beta superfamily hydrolase
MKKIVFFLLCSISVFAQKTVEDFKSEKLEESREIGIGLPQNYAKNVEKRYPLLLLLDGDYLFDPFSGTLTYGAYWEDLPETIVVGIGQNKKNEREADCGSFNEDGFPNEKSAKFFDFITMELMPYLDKKLRIGNLKIIAGHDMTAGFANLFLYKDNPTFNGYISLSPELATHMEVQVPESFGKQKKPLFYYLATADGDVKEMKDGIEMLNTNINLIKNPVINYKFDELKDASHYSLVSYAVPNSLYHIFGAFKPITHKEYEEKIVTMKEGYADYLINKYDIINNTLGLKMKIRFSDFKAIEAAIIENNDFNELDKLAQLANKNYPKSMLGDYFLAKMFEKKADYKQAAKYYQSAFVFKPIGDLTKDGMMEKVNEMRAFLPAKLKKGQKAEELPVVETPAEQVPTTTETPAITDSVAPTETPASTEVPVKTKKAKKKR